MIQRNNILLAVTDLLMHQQAVFHPLYRLNECEDYDGEFDDGEEFTDLVSGFNTLDNKVYTLYQGLHHWISNI